MEKAQKVGKNRPLFLIQKTHQASFAALFELVMKKTLKIEMLNEADFMVKLKLRNNKYWFANICAQVACVQY